VQRILRHASVTTTAGTCGHLSLEDLPNAVARIGPKDRAPVADWLLPKVSEQLPPQSLRQFAERKSPSRVSRVGIEPTTLGLKGQVGLSHGAAGIRKRSQRLDFLGTTIPCVIKVWQVFRSRLLHPCC